MSFDGNKIFENDLNMLNRRQMLGFGAAGVLASIVPLGSSEAQASQNTWRVAFRQAHTGETFNGVYRVGDRYLPEAFERLNYILRDFRTGEVFPMDPRVVDIMALVQKRANQREPIEILSGYRSPKTNAGLRKRTSGVAKNSFHMYGQALDMHIKGYRTSKLRDIARSIRAGGVGYYPKSGFIHVDTGAVRSW